MDGTVRVGRVRASPAFLLAVLGFSSEHRLLTVMRDDEWKRPPENQTISMIIAGPTMPEVPEGHMAPEVNVTYEQGERGWPRMVGVTLQAEDAEQVAKLLREQEASDAEVAQPVTP